MHILTWTRVLERLSGMADVPEVRLIVATIATAIVEEPEEQRLAELHASRCGRPCERRLYAGGFWARGFPVYCRSIGLDPQQIMAMVRDADVAQQIGLSAAVAATYSPEKIREVRALIRTTAADPAWISTGPN